MKSLASRLSISIIILLGVAPLCSAQTGADEYQIKRGSNELGIWAGVAPFRPVTAFAGVTEQEAAGRRFVLAGFRYARTLGANRSLALQYTLDAIPFAIATNNIKSNVPLIRKTTYGGGLSPLGLQLNFRNSARHKPFVHINAGGLIFKDPVPLPDAGRFAYTLEGGGGVRFFNRSGRAVSLGLRLHHISNGDRSGSNRGLNQLIFTTGVSWFK